MQEQYEELPYIHIYQLFTFCPFYFALKKLLLSENKME